MPITRDKFIQIIEDRTAPLTGSSVGFDRAMVLGYALDYMKNNPAKATAVAKIKGYLESIESGGARPKSSTNFEGGQGPLVDLLKAEIKLYDSKAAASKVAARGVAAVSGAQRDPDTFEIGRNGKTRGLADPREGNPGHLPTIRSGAMKGKVDDQRDDPKPAKKVSFAGVKQEKHVSFKLDSGNRGDNLRTS